VKFKVITLGDLVADLIVPIPQLPLFPQQHQPAREITLEAGGTGNFLILAARLGMEAIALGTVGQDYNGDQVLKLLAQENVNISHVIIPPGSSTTTSIVIVDDLGQHVFVGKYATGQPFTLQPEWSQLIGHSQAAFTTGYALHPTSPMTPEVVLTCLATARQANIPTFFDIGPAAFIVNRTHVQAAIAQTEVILATSDETAAWTGLTEPLQAAELLQSQGPSLIVIKLGGDGCLLVSPDEQVHVPGFAVPVRDTAGAGDAFAAACIYGYLAGFSLEQIGRLCNAVGALAVSKLGTGTRLPQKAEVVQLLQQYGHSFLEM
jgi:sugar/nucleoside kinase (ribokinase family)